MCYNLYYNIIRRSPVLLLHVWVLQFEPALNQFYTDTETSI